MCCVVVIVNGCGTGAEQQPMARGGDVTHWPWDEHPPSTPSPDAPAGAEPTSDPVVSGEPAAEQKDSDDDVAGEEAAGGGAAGLEAEVVALTDQIRADQGCAGTLTVDDRLIEAARAHSADMAERDYFDHESPDGHGPAERADEAGYDAWGGENIAVGYATAQEVVDAWMDSDGHRANIVNCGYVAIGIGAVSNDDGTVHWTQSFGWE